MSLLSLSQLVWSRHSQGSPLPASPLYILAEQHRLYIFQQNSIACIYSSRTASPVYISAEQHREYIFQPSSIEQNRPYIFQQNSITCIYFSRISSPLYISAEQHRPYIFQQNSITRIYCCRTPSNSIDRIYSGRTASYVRIRTLGVATPGSGGPSLISSHGQCETGNHEGVPVGIGSIVQSKALY